MTIAVSYIREGREGSTNFVGVATVSENPPQLNLLVTDPVWNDLTETLSGAMILALTLKHSEGEEGKTSILYLKDAEGDRERITNHVFSNGYPSPDMQRFGAQVKTTRVKSGQKPKEKRAGWRWSGNVHGH